MKKYEQPAIELIKFSVMEVILSSETNGGYESEEVTGDFNDLFNY